VQSRLSASYSGAGQRQLWEERILNPSQWLAENWKKSQHQTKFFLLAKLGVQPGMELSG
jgi:hypothetical protein